MPASRGSGPATQEQLEQLHGELRLALWRRLRETRRVPVELLGVVRCFLADNAVSLHDEQSRKALDRIRTLYEEQLLAALQRPNAPASLLLEARRFVEANRFSQGNQPEALPDPGLPFSLN